MVNGYVRNAWKIGNLGSLWKVTKPPKVQSARLEPGEIMKPCPCGSGKNSWWESDARGIPLARVCVDCKQKALSKYRPEVLTNSQYEADEPIEED